MRIDLVTHLTNPSAIAKLEHAQARPGPTGKGLDAYLAGLDAKMQALQGSVLAIQTSIQQFNDRLDELEAAQANDSKTIGKPPVPSSMHS